MAWILASLMDSAAWASPHRVALVDMPANVVKAARTALGPWNVDVVVLPADAELHGDAAARRARLLATDTDAVAVVWLGPDRATLHLHDTERDQIVTRPLASGPPFSEPAAAAVALSIKTMLRNSRAAPRATPESPPAEVAVTPPAQRVAIDATVSARAAPKHVDPRLRLAVAWQPTRISWLDLAAQLHLGPRRSVHTGNFAGKYTDMSIGLELHPYVLARQRLELALITGAALHMTHLSGSVGSSPSESRFDIHPSVHGGVLARTPLLGRLHGHIHLQGTYMLWRTTYDLGARELVVTPRVTGEVGLGISLRW